MLRAFIASSCVSDSVCVYKNMEYRKMYPEETFSICTDCGDVLYIEDYDDCDEG